MVEQTESRIVLNDPSAVAAIFGSHDENLSLIEEALHIRVVVRGEQLIFYGAKEQIAIAEEVFQQLQTFYQAGNGLSRREIQYVLELVSSGIHGSLSSIAQEVIFTTPRGKQIKPKTLNQQRYVESVKKRDIVFAIGPAGTGKTYLAVVMAVKALRAKEVQRLVLTRPAVEAGEKLGFLPGDLQDKVDPYLRPLYDGLYDTLGGENTQKYIERNIIEIVPLAYMRGRTLEDAFVILDEAQNTTVEQMKMFLTRLGFGSKAVITGDITQVDLPPGQVSGLVHAQKILPAIQGIDFQYLTTVDVVRHPLVREIIKAYEQEGKDTQRGMKV